MTPSPLGRISSPSFPFRAVLLHISCLPSNIGQQNESILCFIMSFDRTPWDIFSIAIQRRNKVGSCLSTGVTPNSKDVSEWLQLHSQTAQMSYQQINSFEYKFLSQKERIVFGKF